jgi:hypothetical protein
MQKNQNIENKIEKLIEEALLLAAPGIIPSLQSGFAQGRAEIINSKEDLEKFKKDYKDYKTYDDYTSEAKRGLKYGAMTAIPFGAMSFEHGGDDALETAAGLTGMAMAGGAAIPAIGKGISHLIGDKERIRDIVQAKEKELQKRKI